MSRLYFKGNTDARKTELTARGHRKITGSINWGSKDNSKLAIGFEVIWEKEFARPSVKIIHDADIDPVTRSIQYGGISQGTGSGQSGRQPHPCAGI